MPRQEHGIIDHIRSLPLSAPAGPIGGSASDPLPDGAGHALERCRGREPAHGPGGCIEGQHAAQQGRSRDVTIRRVEFCRPAHRLPHAVSGFPFGSPILAVLFPCVGTKRSGLSTLDLFRSVTSP